MPETSTHQGTGQTSSRLHLSQPPLAAGLPLVGLIPQLFADPLRTLTEAWRPVSYTHLDVYKRQVLVFRRRASSVANANDARRSLLNPSAT